MKQLITCIVLVFSIVSFSDAKGQQTIVYDKTKLLSIGNAVQVLEDKTNKLTVNQVLASSGFRPVTDQILNFGVSNSSFWIKFTVRNAVDANHLLLLLGQPILDSASLYSILPNNTIKVVKQGLLLPYSNRQFDHQDCIFKLDVPTNETRAFLLKINSTTQINIPLYIAITEKVYNSLLKADIVFGIFFGIIFIMFFYNMFVYFSVKDSVYLYYVGYIFILALSQSTLQGYSYKYLWPTSNFLNTYGVLLFTNLGGLAAALFTQKFLQSRSYLPILNKFFNGIIAIFILSLFIIFINKQVSFIIMQVNTLVGSLLAFTMSIIIYRKGYKSAKFFLFAWSALLAGVSIFILKDYGFFPVNTFTSNTLEGGAAIEVVLLSFALADKINTYKREKELSQAEAVRVLHENERLIQQQNIILEQKITERTKALEQTLSELKDAQIQLVESEKMASLGQLTAGIAHEINNPINFVKSNVKPLQMDVQDLFELISRYQKLHTVAEKKELPLLSEIKSFEDQIDPDFIKEEIQSLIGGIEEGAERTAEIVRSLRTFSRLDESELKVANVHDGIDSTLVLLKNTIPSYVKITKYFNAEGDIECYPSKLNQVFMNILTNAVQAITAKQNIGDESIVISTSTIDGQMEISIKDSGIGMTEEVRHKMFDPFFTTKDVGVGTGLGMSITFKIIEKHHGKIAVVSSPGCGTEITISIPYQQLNSLHE